MIKLEDLHKGDIVHYVCKHYWQNSIKITKELYMKYGYEVVNGKFTKGSIEYLTKTSEPYLFKTRKEADEEIKRLRKERKTYLNNKDNLLELINSNSSFLADADREIINELRKVGK